jgi:hypothetical protein
MVKDLGSLYDSDNNADIFIDGLLVKKKMEKLSPFRLKNDILSSILI